MQPIDDTEVQQRSVGELISEVASDMTQLMRKEIELAKVELKEEAAKSGKAAGFLGGAGYAGHMVALFLSIALLFGLAAVMPDGWAAVIVAVLWAAVGAFLFVSGRKQLRTVHPKPTQTVETLKEDAQWAKTLTR